MKQRIIFLSLILMIGLGLIGLGQPSASAQPSTSAQLRVIHAVADAPAVDVYLDGLLIAPALEFEASTLHINLEAGSHELALRAAGADASDPTLYEQDLNLLPGFPYSAILQGAPNSLSALLYEDILDPLSLGEARLGVVNAVLGAPAVDLYRINPEAPLLPSIAFGQPSGTINSPVGVYELVVVATGDDPNDALGTLGLVNLSSHTASLIILTADGDDLGGFVVSSPTLPQGSTSPTRFINASADGAAYDLYLNNALAIPNLSATEATPHLNLPQGEHDLALREGGALPNSEAIFETRISIGNAPQSFAIVLDENDELSLPTFADAAVGISAAQARLQAFNLSAEALSLEVAGETLADDLAAGEAGDGLDLAPGDYSIGGDVALNVELFGGVLYSLVVFDDGSEALFSTPLDLQLAGLPYQQAEGVEVALADDGDDAEADDAEAETASDDAEADDAEAEEESEMLLAPLPSPDLNLAATPTRNPNDLDGDGVPNDRDLCPSLGDIGHGVDINGCPLPPPDQDLDGDGVPDIRDVCPNDGDKGFGVDENGCPLPDPAAATPEPTSEPIRITAEPTLPPVQSAEPTLPPLPTPEPNLAVAPLPTAVAPAVQPTLPGPAAVGVQARPTRPFIFPPVEVVFGVVSLNQGANLQCREYPSSQARSLGLIPTNTELVIQGLFGPRDTSGDQGGRFDAITIEGVPDFTPITSPDVAVESFPELGSIPVTDLWLNVDWPQPDGSAFGCWVNAQYIMVSHDNQRIDNTQRYMLLVQMRNIDLTPYNIPGGPRADGVSVLPPTPQAQTNPNRITALVNINQGVNLQLRRTPSVQGESLGLIPNAAQLIAFRTVQGDPSEGSTVWVWVLYVRPDNIRSYGWVATDYLIFQRGDSFIQAADIPRSSLDNAPIGGFVNSAGDIVPNISDLDNAPSTAGGAAAPTVPPPAPSRSDVVGRLLTSPGMSLNLRELPDGNSIVRATLDNSIILTVIGRSGDGLWLEVVAALPTGDLPGWVAANFVLLSRGGEAFELADLPVTYGEDTLGTTP